MSPGECGTATDRRSFLRGAAGAGTTALAAGATPAAAQQFGGWFEDVPNYAGEIVDYTGEAEVTVEVGVETENGPYGFGPPAVRVDPGTTVTFSWVSDAHNVLPESQPEAAGWTGHETIENTGFEFSHSFDVEGVYLYYCDPHLPLGMKGAVVVGDAGVGGGDGGEAGEAGDGGEGAADGAEAGGVSLTPGIVMVGGSVALSAVSAVAFGLFLLLRGGGGGATAAEGERATDGGAVEGSEDGAGDGTRAGDGARAGDGTRNRDGDADEAAADGVQSAGRDARQP